MWHLHDEQRGVRLMNSCCCTSKVAEGFVSETRGLAALLFRRGRVLRDVAFPGIGGLVRCHCYDPFSTIELSRTFFVFLVSLRVCMRFVVVNPGYDRSDKQGHRQKIIESRSTSTRPKIRELTTHDKYLIEDVLCTAYRAEFVIS